MSKYVEKPIGELFEARGGDAQFIKDYFRAHPGEHPVYSGSLAAPFGFVDEFTYEGTYLTWVMNGYGGRVQEVSGKFSVTRDRGVFVPRPELVDRLPDLSYLRFAMESRLVAAAIGRRVDGKANEFTKIYPGDAAEVEISIPITENGAFDYQWMREVGERLRRIEGLKQRMGDRLLALKRASLILEVPAPSLSIDLGNTAYFDLSIGKRIIRQDTGEVPAYSANVLAPFARVTTSNLSDFSRPSLLWGIDGNFDWNLIPAGEHFATTDHCGRLQIKSGLDPEYVYAYLKGTGQRYGFDRVYRASLRKVSADVSVVVPVGEDGKPSKSRQKALANAFKRQTSAQTKALTAFSEVYRARLATELDADEDPTVAILSTSD